MEKLQLSREEIKKRLLRARVFTTSGKELSPELCGVGACRPPANRDSKWMRPYWRACTAPSGHLPASVRPAGPLIEYKYEAYEMFQEMIHSIREDVVRLLFHLKVNQALERQRVAKPTISLKAEGKGAMEEAKGATSAGKRTPVTAGKVGRNDPCPCGSGKKFKNCCGA